MDAKHRDRLWTVSLLFISASAIILAGARLTGAHLPDLIVRGLGLLDLAALPVFAFATVKRWNRRR